MTALKRTIERSRGGEGESLQRNFNSLKSRLEEAKKKKPGAVAAKITMMAGEFDAKIVRHEYDLARTTLSNLTLLVDKALGEGVPMTPVPVLSESQKALEAWNALQASQDYKTTDARITDLEKWNAAEKTTLRGKFAALTTEATTNTNPKKACDDFPAVKSEVEETNKGRRALREHGVEMAAMRGELAVAERVPGRNVPSRPNLRDLWVAYDAAKSAVTGAENMTDCARLPELRKNLKTAAVNLITEYKTTGVASNPLFQGWLEEKYIADLNANLALFQKAMCVPLKTPAMARLRKEMDDAKTRARAHIRAGEIVEAERAMTERIEKAKALLAARGGTDKDEARFYKEYRKIEAWVEQAVKEPHDKDPTKTAFNNFRPFYDDFRKKWNEGKFKECRTFIRELKNKADAVLEETKKAALRRVDGVLALPAGSASEKTEKSDRAQEAIENIPDVVMAEMPAKKKVELLKALRADPIPDADQDDPASTANEPKRVAQRKVYQNMKMDEAFVEADNKKRKELVESLKNNPKIQKAKDNWAIMDQAEREEVFTEVLEAQCQAFGFKKPKNGMVFYDFTTHTPPPKLDPDDNGHYDPGAEQIRINTAAATFHDFELSIDLIAHENSHNYQDQLCQRARLPSSDKNQLKPNENDPLYRQVMMFDVNDVPAAAYVPGGEDYEIYRKQPLEEHAWYAGPKTAHGLLKALGR